jgi:hypothetical protein
MSLRYGNPLDGYGYSTASGYGSPDVRVHKLNSRSGILPVIKFSPHKYLDTWKPMSRSSGF